MNKFFVSKLQTVREFTDEMNDVKQRLHRCEHQNDDIIGALRELKTMISEIQKKSFRRLQLEVLFHEYAD